jgi:hypothetical protein
MGAAPAAPSGGGGGALKWIGIGCGVLILLSCLCGIGWWALMFFAAASTAPVPMSGGSPVVTTPAMPTAPPATGGGSLCQRATDCCHAYVLAVPSAAGTPCDTYATFPIEAGCQSAIDGFRAGLTAMGQAVPPACQ